MKKINRKKTLIITIILIISLIVIVKLLDNAKADDLVEINANIIDNTGLLSDANYTIIASNEGEYGYSITLPDTVNNKKISKYYIENKNIVNDETNLTNETNNSQIVEKNAGEKIYLTEEELTNKQIILNVEYDKKEKTEQTLYNQILEKEIEQDKITITGYVPVNAEISFEKLENATIEEQLTEYINEKTTLETAYEIKILSEETEFEPKEYEEEVEVKIQGIQIDNNKNYRIIHIYEQIQETTQEITTIIEEIKEVVTAEDGISFKTSQFSTYAILTEDAETSANQEDVLTNEELGISTLADDTIYQTTYAMTNSGGAWDGTTVATSFSWGDGTEVAPYLIADGAELAYLAEQVRNGNTYEGVYFQIANDIDLGNNFWTPIGNAQNSFRGILDGAGHTIANAQITISSLPDATYEAYGIFGSIGGGNTRAIIRNLELSNINIDITASGDTGSSSIFGGLDQDAEGLHIGTLTGAMYRNSSVLNVIVKNSLIEDSNIINIYHYPFQLSIGGVVGYVANGYNNTTNPGTNNTYEIQNCYSSAVIDIDATAEYETGGWFTQARNGYGHYHTGGIVGTIRSQAVWPSNCLYSGTINSNGFIGPIFGALINNTTYENFNTFSTIWNGNDAGNLTANNMYYTNYSANGRTFTSTVISGTSTQRLSNSSTNIGYVQGVNKGSYTTDMNAILNMFNNNVTTDNKYVNWYYQNGEFTFKERLTSEVEETVEFTYEIMIDDPYNIGNYTYKWYKNGTEDTSIQGSTYTWTPNYLEDENIIVVISDGEYYTVTKFTIKKIGVDIVFDINETNDSVTASLEGEGLKYTSVSDFTFQWYALDISGEETKIDGATTLSLSNLEDGMEYKLVATNAKIPQMSTENSFIYGDRTVIYVNYNSGNDRNDGFTPETPVRTLSTAYRKLDSNGTRNTNVIVIMGTYSSTSYMNSQTSTTYAKPVTITGKYDGVNYNGILYFYSGTSSYRYLTADTNFQYLTFYGGNNQMYFYLQGYSLTIGEGVTMQNYANSNSNQGLLGGNAPAFHIICGWLQYNYTRLPRNNPEILIKSGTYGRIIGGGSPGTSSGQGQTTSHDFMGSSMEDSFKVTITIDIKNSTTASNYDYDVNLLTGGSACGNNYSRVTENIKNGSIGRVLGGSIGDSENIPLEGGDWWGGGTPWKYPNNTFLGETTINVTGGTISELYGGCLGRNMGAVDQNTGVVDEGYTGYTCDSYFYGTVNINITGGEITNNIYGAGAGGVTGYSEESSDPYKSYGQSFDTSVNINISGGTISGNVYGGGYGYTEYLNANVTAADGGALYGDSNIVISGTPIINGNIYAAGCGYDMSKKPEIAQMTGTSNITITGNPTIKGKIFGAGAGVSGYEEMAKLTGTSNITIESDLSVEVYGGGNIAKTEGTTNININSGNHTGDIYGGGNLGIIDGNTNVNINGGTQTRVFGGGNQANVTTSNVNINGGNTTEIYAGGNSASVDTTYVTLQGGTANTIYGGSNQTGTIQNSNVVTLSGTANEIYGGNNLGGTTNKSNITINGGTINTAVYGGGNQVETPETYVEIQKTYNEIPSIFGGGNQAGSTTTNIIANGGTVENIYGGSNLSGTVENSNVTANNGTIQNIFGGGNQADTTTTNVNITGGTIENTYGGGNQAGSTTTNVTANGGTIENIFGGSNMSGTVENSNVTTHSGTIQNVYGGNNQGGTTTTPNVIINGTGVTNVYGGGNQAVTNVTNVQINGHVAGSVYGGGNQAGVNTNTNINIIGGTVENNVYGGGNEGTVTGNTYVHIKNATLNNSVYAGGNGSNAIVYGNTNLIMDGTSNSVAKNVFGGGNKAATGTEANKTSISTVNIVGGKIGGNVYGGANTSVVYGITKTNIGYDAVGDNTLEIGNIEITGTIFGGGEANEAGDENYDYSFISVTDGIDIQIDGNQHDEFAIYGSIFGSGNASSTEGESYITIKNYGTADNPQSNISLQRANCATIINSAMSLSGATDRTNEYKDTFFSISRVDEVKLVNNSTLYLCNGANLLKKLSSVLEENGTQTKGEVTINPDTGKTTKNVDNRIYMLEGKNLNIATNEQVTTYGQVDGMFFLGLFTNKLNPSTSTGFYHSGYENGDTITNAGTFSLNSYAMAQHMLNHDTTKDGFYTNYNEDGIIKTDYIKTTPEDDVYYIWLAGEKMEVTVFEISLTASKYATLGTYELLLQGFSDPNIKFSIQGFSAGLANGIELVNPSEIETIAQDEEIANSIYGLTMETGNTGWQTKGSTTFLTENGGNYTGTSNYDADNSTYTPTLNFYLYHSQNLTLEQPLGDVRIRLQVLTPVDDLNYDISYIDINITINTALYQDDFYEAAITPGQKFGLFTTTDTTITSKSDFSTYYSLYIEEFDQSKYYQNYAEYERVLVSRDSNNLPYSFPVDTKITMLDMVTNKYYYYIVTEDDVNSNKYIYKLSDFTVMGSEDAKFDEPEATESYYIQDQNLIYENFIFHISFADTNMTEDIRNNTLLIELRDKNEQTLLGVLGIQRDIMIYTVYCNQDATIKLDATIDPENVYLGNKINLDVKTTFTQTVVDSKKVYDTQYFDKKLGIKITIYDANGNQLNNDSLLGINFELDGQKYYPRVDGTTRIKIADKVTDVLARIKINTENNTTLATGDYKIKIESFGSSDGIYYGITASDTIELNFKIINIAYGLKVKTSDKDKIVDKETGITSDGNDSIVITLEYSSALANPNIAISLYRRNYTEIFSQDYELVDLKDYTTNTLTATKREKEYVISENPLTNLNYFLKLKPDLVTGTYKLVYKLYDGDVYVGEAYEYMIIK